MSDVAALEAEVKEFKLQVREKKIPWPHYDRPMQRKGPTNPIRVIA